MKTFQLRWESQNNPPPSRGGAGQVSSACLGLARAPSGLCWSGGSELWWREASGQLGNPADCPSSWLLNVQFSMALLSPLQQMPGPTGCPLHCLSHIHCWLPRGWRWEAKTLCASHSSQIYQFNGLIYVFSLGNYPSHKTKNKENPPIRSKRLFVGYLYPIAAL